MAVWDYEVFGMPDKFITNYIIFDKPHKKKPVYLTTTDKHLFNVDGGNK